MAGTVLNRGSEASRWSSSLCFTADIIAHDYALTSLDNTDPPGITP